MSINLLNPLANHKTINNFSTFTEFKKLSAKHQIITFIASAALTALTFALIAAAYIQFYPVHAFHPYFNIGVQAIAAASIIGLCIFPYLRQMIGRFRALEKEVAFFEWSARKHQFISSILINGVNDGKNHHAIAECIVENYIGDTQTTNPTFQLNETEKKFLIKFYEAQFDKPISSEILEEILSPGKKLIIYPTKGDGTCGLHALLGDFKEGQYSCDAELRREQFCSWIRSENARGKLPEKIRNILEDYFINFDNPNTPSYFKDQVKDLRNKYFVNYSNLSDVDQDLQKDFFIAQPKVIEAYLKNLRQIGTYLLQPELLVAAECFGINLILYQNAKEWYGKDEVVCSHPLMYVKAGANHETVCILYGNRHYERVYLKAPLRIGL